MNSFSQFQLNLIAGTLLLSGIREDKIKEVIHTLENKEKEEENTEKKEILLICYEYGRTGYLQTFVSQSDSDMLREYQRDVFFYRRCNTEHHLSNIQHIANKTLIQNELDKQYFIEEHVTWTFGENEFCDIHALICFLKEKYQSV